MTTLLVRDLSVSFLGKKQNKKKAVEGVSFHLDPGETVAIVGETGCGKSALAKALIRLFPKNTAEVLGQVLLQKQNLLSLSEKELQEIRGKQIGMIFQDPMTALNPTMRVGEQVLEGILRSTPRLSHKEAWQKVIELLEWVGIQDASQRAFDFPHTLSGGLRQRMMIAIALASKPQILIADEPTTALDVTIQAQILSLFKNIQKTFGMSLLLITHDLGVVASVCDRVLVMYGGHIVESASVEDLFYRPKHPYTQGLIQATPKIHLGEEEAPLIPIEGRPPDLSSPLKGCPFHPRCSAALDICKTKAPSLLEVVPTHFASCWLGRQP